MKGRYLWFLIKDFFQGTYLAKCLVGYYPQKNGGLLWWGGYNQTFTLITWNHVIDEEIIKQNDNIIVIINNNKEKRITQLKKNRKTYINSKEGYNTTIIEIKEGDNINKYLDLFIWW